MSHNLAERLADFALSTRFEELPPRVVSEAVARWLDTLACAIGALREPAPRIARRTAERASGGYGLELIGGGRSTPDWTTFSDGVHIRYLDCNDTYLSLEPAHPSDNWSAIRAAGELARRPGSEWIAAAAVAYEVQCRLCDAASIRSRGWDHVTYGTLSSCLAAARLLGLEHRQAVHALGIAGTIGTALRLTRAGELSMWKGCAFASAARSGVFAALLAAEGMTGPAPLFEGEMGFFEQVSGPFSIDMLGGRSDADWMLPRTSIKFVPAEYHSQSAIAAAFALRPRIGDPRRIRSIRVDTFRVAVEIIAKDPEKWRPLTRETADHSLPYCTAVALLDGEITARQFSPERLADPFLRDLVSRTEVVEDRHYTAMYPIHTPNRIVVTLDDGQVLEQEYIDPPGHDKNPLTQEGLRAKFDGLVIPELGTESARAIWDRASTLATDPAPAEVVALINSCRTQTE
ncbi:MAG: 2-methylcitrate dehydratase [Isosphaeraceae bacterium]|jgi:2-methylcitrate dehydratase|nr:MAG: 2-methylcitrate dehydratase [Isosphaeraceae bacterium]